MEKLRIQEFEKVRPLVKSQNELSVQSVIQGTMPGEIYVNNSDHPTAALIQTEECNLIAGDWKDETFHSEVKSLLDFWDQLTPDSDEWAKIIPSIHKNAFLKTYQRRRYVLDIEDFQPWKEELPEEYRLEQADVTKETLQGLENFDEVQEWIAGWKNHKTFKNCGSGYLIHNNKRIVSWSLSDCYLGQKIAIGVHTDERYKGRGFGKNVVSATIKDAFAKGYTKIDWLCVDSNKGSISIAEKLGFVMENTYESFSSYPPIENPTDLTEEEWFEWAEYLDNASDTESALLIDCLYAYINANEVEKALGILQRMTAENCRINYSRINQHIQRIQSNGMGSNFRDELG